MDAVINSLIQKVRDRVEKDNVLDSVIKQVVDKAIMQLYPYILGLVIVLCVMIILQGIISYQLIIGHVGHVIGSANVVRTATL